jgi:NAD(P)-dependent dehydrogenase (short-subunit alcohol dehydrogenase family)
MSGVVVTGAASGIGRASAEALVADGRKVALWDIAPEVTAVADGLGVPGAVVDVCDAAAMQAAVGEADEKLGGIDGLLHAAGRLPPNPRAPIRRSRGTPCSTSTYGLRRCCCGCCCHA